MRSKSKTGKKPSRGRRAATASQSPVQIGEGSAPPTNLEEECRKLRVERDRLLEQVVELRIERAEFLRALYALTRESLDFDKKLLLEQAGKGQSLQDMIAELEAQGS